MNGKQGVAQARWIPRLVRQAAPWTLRHSKPFCGCAPGALPKAQGCLQRKSPREGLHRRPARGRCPPAPAIAQRPRPCQFRTHTKLLLGEASRWKCRRRTTPAKTTYMIFKSRRRALRKAGFHDRALQFVNQSLTCRLVLSEYSESFAFVLASGKGHRKCSSPQHLQAIALSLSRKNFSRLSTRRLHMMVLEDTGDPKYLLPNIVTVFARSSSRAFVTFTSIRLVSLWPRAVCAAQVMRLRQSLTPIKLRNSRMRASSRFPSSAASSSEAER
mmetsp:Transcript_34728/g.82381  ORF Transcript_34728/g.82381 Transcript_34728/m.82381 type:complete len:272 (+) Transcript_34728:92-907(+)